MKTAEGMVEFSAPQVRDTPEPFVSAIRENLAGRTQALEELELYARGLSTRDIEDASCEGRRGFEKDALAHNSAPKVNTIFNGCRVADMIATVC